MPRFTRSTAIAAFLLCAATAAPAGMTPAGLPVGLQIVGRRFDDLGVLQASAAFEQAQPWADKRPKLA